MNKFWDDDWDYNINLWVQTEKTFDEFIYSMKKILSMDFEENKFKVGGIDCEITDVMEQPFKFAGIPEEKYSYVICIPISTDLVWSSIDKSFAIGLALSIRYTFKCKYLITADNDFFIAFSGSNQPLYLNSRYKPWSRELAIFTEGQKKIELSLM